MVIRPAKSQEAAALAHALRVAGEVLSTAVDVGYILAVAPVGIPHRIALAVAF
jgi:hypothetical protein